MLKTRLSRFLVNSNNTGWCYSEMSWLRAWYFWRLQRGATCDENRVVSRKEGFILLQ
jgi:hypothetical protein